MNNELRSFLKENNIDCKRITLKKGVKIISSSDGDYVIKKRTGDISKIYNYLHSRAFDYFPRLVTTNDDYDIYEYVDGIEQPKEQSASDIMSLLSLLHGKTTFYKEIDLDSYKYIYENLKDKTIYLYNYYMDLITLIEREVYMSPSFYLLARNISKVFICLDFCNQNLDKWYELIKGKRRVRMVSLHNNVDLEHYLKTDQSYLVSWDKSKLGMPIYDLEMFYRKNYLDLDFQTLFGQYEGRFPLLKEERILLFILIAMPDKIEFSMNEYDDCVKIRRFLDYIYKTEQLIREYEIKKD